MDGDVGPRRSDDDVAVDGDTSYQVGYAPSGTSPGRSGPFGAVRLT